MNRITRFISAMESKAYKKPEFLQIDGSMLEGGG
jgi:hypothetical protein